MSKHNVLMIHEISDEIIEKANAAHREGYEITLDDGLVQQFEARHELPPSTFFVAAGLIDERAPKARKKVGKIKPSEALSMAHLEADRSAYMTKANLIELISEGRHEVGVHGFFHAQACFLSADDSYPVLAVSKDKKKWAMYLWERMRRKHPDVDERVLAKMAKHTVISSAPAGSLGIIFGTKVETATKGTEMFEIEIDSALEFFSSVGLRPTKFCWPFNIEDWRCRQVLSDNGFDRVYGPERIDVEAYEL